MRKKRCVRCSRMLEKEKLREPVSTQFEAVVCTCGKPYMYDRMHGSYRLGTKADFANLPGADQYIRW